MSELYTIYDTATGEILRECETSAKNQAATHIIQINTGPGETAYIGASIDGALWWFDQGIPVMRPAADFAPLSAPITAGDVRTLTGLPDGAVVAVSRPEGSDISGVVGASGEMVITLADVGPYRLAVTSAFPFAASEIEINVNAAS